MKIKLGTIFVMLFIFFTSTVGAVVAADVLVVFEANGCMLSPEAGALFAELDVKPGDQIVRTVDVVNNSEETVQLGILMDNVSESGLFNHLSEVLDLQVVNTDTGETLHESMTMGDWKNKVLILPSIPAETTTTTYAFYVSMDSKHGNEYQKKEFSFDLVFQCEGLTENPGQIAGASDEKPLIEKIVEKTGDILGTFIERLPDTGKIGITFLVAFFVIGLGIFMRRNKS